jgi:hypothetical protein
MNQITREFHDDAHHSFFGGAAVAGGEQVLQL